jgi:serine/threonine protein kinase
LYAFSQSEDLRSGYFLVYDLAEKGSLEMFWKDDVGRERLGSFSRRVQIAMEVCTAIRFLHVGNDKIQCCFHRDLKSANVVIKRDFTAQLIDCGLAKFVKEDNQSATTGVKGTPGYVCPRYGRGGILYDESCDIYSFGIVLAELWTGRTQNFVEENGSVFNFYDHYVDDDDRDMCDDLDAALSLDASDPPQYATDYKELALSCMDSKPKKRPHGADILDILQKIWRTCVMAEEEDEPLKKVSSLDVSSPIVAHEGSTCSRCRTFVVLAGQSTCALCKSLEEERGNITSVLEEMVFSLNSLRIENRSLHSNISAKLDSMMPVLSSLDVRLNSPIPRLFVLVPADLQNGRQHPRSWLRSKFRTKYHLFFVCAHSYEVVSPPLKFTVSHAWVDKIAPALGVSLILLQIAGKVITGLDFQAGDVGMAALQLSSTELGEMLDTVMSILEGTADLDLLERVRSGQELCDSDVQKLNGDALEMVKEKAREQRGWRVAMEPVKVKDDARIFWVSKAVAEEPANGYAIVDV